jgi:hypothetical protein
LGGKVDIKDRIRELAEDAGVELHTPEDRARCWVDGSVRCPYGFPEGQYILRPSQYCHESFERGNGCAVYAQHVQEPELRDDLKTAAIREHFAAQQTDVTSELRARADEIEARDPVEAKALQLAADIIEDRKLDRNILLEADLPVD